MFVNCRLLTVCTYIKINRLNIRNNVFTAVIWPIYFVVAHMKIFVNRILLTVCTYIKVNRLSIRNNVFTAIADNLLAISIVMTRLLFGIFIMYKFVWQILALILNNLSWSSAIMLSRSSNCPFFSFRTRENSLSRVSNLRS